MNIKYLPGFDSLQYDDNAKDQEKTFGMAPCLYCLDS